MKRVKFLTVMSVIALGALFGASAYAQEAFTDSTKSLEIIISGLQVYPEDLPDYKYAEANDACKRKNSINSQGHNDWRLPTIEELEIIYEQRYQIVGLKSGLYLSNNVWMTHGTRPCRWCRKPHLWHGKYLDFSSGKMVQRDLRCASPCTHEVLPAGHVRLVRGKYK